MTIAYIFDLDGTLVDLPVNYWAMFADFKQIMRVQEVRPILKTVAEIKDPQTRKRVFDTWERYELAVVQKTIFHEEGIRIYRAHADEPKALVTMQGKKTVNALLAKFGLDFGAIVTREDSFDRVEQLKMAAGKLKVNIREVLFVGNMDNDADAAKKVGCQFKLVK
jgi:HAD superfamily hydrolase (TIGR01549 family)